jgi:DNA-binding transcriptional LysR family regulator
VHNLDVYQWLQIVIRFLFMKNKQESSIPLWSDLQVLLALHRHGSFLGAGKVLGISTSTTARRIEALETALGRPLVRRTNEGTLLEPDTLPLLQLAEQIELGLRAFHRDEDKLSGVVRISLSDGFLQPVTQCICQLRRIHPGLRVELISEPRRVDLERREADIGLRIGRTSSKALVERHLGVVSRGLYAAPSYIERRLRTNQVKMCELARHDIIGWEGPAAKLPPLNWLEEQGIKKFVFRANSYFAILEAARQGQGIALLAGSLPGLVRLESDAAPPSLSAYMVYHRDVRRVPRVKLVIDAIIAALKEE